MLSMAGRTTLIKPTLNPQPNYVMQYIEIPTQVVTRMNRYQRNFLWGTTECKKKIHLIKWSVVQKPKHQSGLGIQNLATKNKALLGN